MIRTRKIRFFALLLIIASCSTKKDAFLNRNFHAMTTKYNVLHNGKMAFAKGIREVNSQYEDDFFERLPIEPIKFKGNIIEAPKFRGLEGPGLSNNNTSKDDQTPFDIAEEKAVKAIQKHSMRIRGKEKNKQIDDAYLLLGKARYYTERFIPAIEAYNYIINNYPKANLINETKLWRSKANIRIDNPELAIETLKIMVRNKDLPDEIKEEAHTSLAMAHMKMDSLHLVKDQLWLATQTHKNKVQTARNLYILGQLYEEDQNRDTAALVFKRLVDFKQAPYKFRIHAQIQLAKNSVNDSTVTSILDRFIKLIKNRDNRPYLDALYYEVAELEMSRDSVDRAVASYNRSLRASQASAKQKTYSYEKLANIYFKQLDYVKASSYYDSVLVVAQDKETLRMKRIERRARNLSLLRKYEKTLKINDSVLTLVNMPEKERNNYFQKFIDKIKKEDEELAQKKLNAISFGNQFGGGSQSSKNNQGKWYFYNVQSLGFGKGEFERIWGTRPLEDNWRWSDKTSNTSKARDEVAINQNSARYDVATYTKTIPSDKKVIDSLIFDRNQALFELGLIYKEQFKNIPKAIGNLERLLDSDPDKELILPTNYHLYLLYSDQGDSKADKHKNVVLTDYKDTPFAKIILNPDQDIINEDEVDEIEQLYKIAYRLYKDEFYDECTCFIETMLPELKDSNLTPKFELLRAYAIGKYNSKTLFMAELEKVAVDYAQTEQGKKALELIEQLKKSNHNGKQ